MDAPAIHARLRERFAADILGELVAPVVVGSEEEKALGKKGYRPRDAFCTIVPEHVAEVMLVLRDDPELQFDFMQNLTAVDYPAGGALSEFAQDNTIAVIYHLYSYSLKHSMCFKTFAPRDEPRVPSVSAIWPVADWHEREAYDLFGVIFTGHPDLRRIMLPEEFEGYPCRKDYVERPMVLGIPTTRYSALNLMKQLNES